MLDNIYLKLSIVILFLSVIESCPNGEKIITAPAGNFSGNILKFEEGNVTEYLGIPFAHPPTGPYRFKAPAPINFSDPTLRWNTTFNALYLAKPCIQYIQSDDFSTSDDLNIAGNTSEDCLQLNMWVPQNCTGSVIVFIFGGSFNFGSPSYDNYNGSVLALLTQSIVVNLNYRLGIFGFAYLGDDSDVKGNMGFLDQQVGLKWVHDNIEAFGGNKTNVTLFGESAGAASITAHLFSETSYSYFNKLIVCSGVITNVWATVPGYIAKNNTLRVAENLNCTGNNTEHILECLQKAQNTSLLLESLTLDLHPDQPSVNVPFLPIDNDTVFFNGSVEQKKISSTVKNKTDMIIGRTFDEGTYFMPVYLAEHGCDIVPSRNEDNECLLGRGAYSYVLGWISSMMGFNNTEMESLKEVYDKVKTNKTRGKIAELLSDFLLDCNSSAFAQWYYNRTQSNVYFFEFRKRSPITPWPKWMGAMHGWELPYFFGHPFRYPGNYTNTTIGKEQNFTKKLMDTIKVFVTSGDLGQRWKKFNGTSQKALVIGENFTETSNGTFYNETYVNAFSKTCKGFCDVFSKFMERTKKNSKKNKRKGKSKN